MSTCTDKSDDATLSSSNNTAAVDDIISGINKVALEDVNNTPPRDIIGEGEEDMNSEKKKCTSCEQNLEHIKSHEIRHGNADTTDIVSEDVVSCVDVSICANCGKEGASNTCNKCKMVKYCNAVCKKRHRHKHKKDCEEHLRCVAEVQEEEIRRAAELHDLELFKQPPTIDDDCPICFQRLPFLDTGKRYKPCCGKVICSGCIHAVELSDEDALCPFCRTPTPYTEDENVRQLMKRVDAGDAEGINNLGFYLSNGMNGLSQDYAKALELFHRAAELGNITSHYNLGNVYYNGRGAKIDKKKAINYYELAAMRGLVEARHNLAIIEKRRGNIYIGRAIKHYMIAVEGGSNISLANIQKFYSCGRVTKDEYTKALRAYQKYLDEVKSTQRDHAAAAREDYKYI